MNDLSYTIDDPTTDNYGFFKYDNYKTCHFI